VAVLVQEQEGFDDLGGEPCRAGVIAALVLARDGGTGADDRLESGVGRDGEAARSDALCERFGYVESIVEGDNRPLAGLDPFDLRLAANAEPVRVSHREPALRIGLQQAGHDPRLGREVCW